MGSSPEKVSMATIQAQMLSGWYRTQRLCSLWSLHTSEFCLLSPSCSNSPEDIEHILNHCEALQPVRAKLQRFAMHYANNFDHIRPIVKKYCDPFHPQFCQFLLDCSVLQDVIVAVQMNGHGGDVLKHLFHITRTFVYNVHKTRMKLLGRWNPF